MKMFRAKVAAKICRKSDDVDVDDDDVNDNDGDADVADDKWKCHLVGIERESKKNQKVIFELSYFFFVLFFWEAKVSLAENRINKPQFLQVLVVARVS